jgi:hypothetical protein
LRVKREFDFENSCGMVEFRDTGQDSETDNFVPAGFRAGDVVNDREEKSLRGKPRERQAGTGIPRFLG